MLRPSACQVVAARCSIAAVALFAATGSRLASQEPSQDSQKFRFESRVELVNVTATVSDASGRFVPGLTKNDFVLYEDGRPQEISLFSNERVPVSLGIALDTSGSMQGEKMDAARDALERFLGDLLAREDEIFLYRFDDDVQLVQGWTSRRDLLRRALGRITPRGGTMLYNTVAEAVPMAETGRYRKKALVIISDGNDTSSTISVPELKQRIRETEVLVYAIGIDARAEPTLRSGGGPRFPLPIPIPLPGPGRRGPLSGPRPTPPLPPRAPILSGGRVDEPVNVAALRELTDDSGGRTEVVRTAHDLNPATASVADELSRQYYLGYHSPSAGDGRWHSIRVDVRNGQFLVRARRGYTGTP